jgi:hypothetical protein
MIIKTDVVCVRLEKVFNFADETPMSHSTQKEMYKAWVIHPNPLIPYIL